MKVAAVPDEALLLLRSLSKQGILQEALRQIMAPSGGSSMSDASKRRGDDLILEPGEFHLIADADDGESDPSLQMGVNDLIIRGVKVPEGIKEVHTWGRTVCTLSKVEKRRISYQELVQEANYLRWVRKNP